MQKLNKKNIREIAQRRIKKLFDLAILETHNKRFDLSTRYVTLALKLSLHYRIRIREYKHLYCKKCHSILLQGSTCRTRIKNGKVITKCLVCGNYRRVPIKEAYSPIVSNWNST